MRFCSRSSDAEDAGQQVVEVVGDAAGELADGLHLLGLAQRLLRLRELASRAPSGADVAPDGDEVDAVRLGRDGPLDRRPAAVRGGDAVLEARSAAGLAHARRALQAVGPTSSGWMKSRRAGEQLGLGPAEHARPGGVDGGHRAL